MSASAEADLERLHRQRARLLARLAVTCADIGRRLDPDSFGQVAELERTDALERRARAAEAELGEIESRLAEARANGVRRRR